MSEAKTASPLESAVHSIAWMHQLGGEPPPTDHPLVKSILSSAQRLLTHHTSNKEPITVSQLVQLVACKADAMASLYNIRLVVICLIAIAAFLRLDELAKLVRSDVEIKSDMFKFFIEPSKTDQYSFISQSNLSCSFNEPIFRKGEASPSQPSFLSITEN